MACRDSRRDGIGGTLQLHSKISVSGAQLAYILVAIDGLAEMPLLCGQFCNAFPFLAVLQKLESEIWLQT